MTKMKPLTQRDIRDLSNLRVQRGLRMPDLAKELGVAERTLSRYFEGTLPRNNEKGRKAYAKIRELLKEFRASAPKDLPKPKDREKRVTVSGVFLTDEQVRDVHEYMSREMVLIGDVAKSLGISDGHLLSVIRQEDKASIKLRNAIVQLVTKKPELPQTMEEAMRLSDAAAENLQTTEVVETVTSSGLDRKSLDLNTSDEDAPQATIGTSNPRPVTRPIFGQIFSRDESTETELYTHEFRLRADVVVKIPLPTDLTAEEAERVASFIMLLSI